MSSLPDKLYLELPDGKFRELSDGESTRVREYYAEQESLRLKIQALELELLMSIGKTSDDPMLSKVFFDEAGFPFNIRNFILTQRVDLV